MLEKCLSHALNYFLQLKRAIDLARKTDKQGDLSLDLQIFGCKLKKISQFLPHAARCDPHDIFVRPPDDAYFQELKPFVNIKRIADEAVLEASFEKANMKLRAAFATAIIMDKQKEGAHF